LVLGFFHFTLDFRDAPRLSSLSLLSPALFHHRGRFPDSRSRAATGIQTPGDLERAIAAGKSGPARDGKTIHRICHQSAYIVYNALTRTLITFSQGDPAVGEK
jgi:hypothetical protein